jgi:aryl-alcohol dehydrogenase-like predicted oxidoreductase
MEYRRLGRSDLRVSAICLGTMTWGKQNTEADGHLQMDYALDHGVNFWDTAEMYAVPPSAETYGKTETIIGSWMRKNPGKRDKVILASKIAGPGREISYVREGKSGLDPKNIAAAVDASLKRLQTDHIDLYQLHWPARSVNIFGQLGYIHHPDEVWTPLEETLAGLDAVIKAGKVRHVGLSNETAWGCSRYLKLAEQGKGPRMVSNQNAYNLLNRSYEVAMAEISIREDCGLLAFSPLGMGVLSGKYLDGAMPRGARITLFGDRYKRYTTPQAQAATKAYVELARRHGLDPAQMALAYVTSRSFVTSTIIGATSLDQLKSDIGSIEISLSDEVVEAVDAINKVHTYPGA